MTEQPTRSETNLLSQEEPVPATLGARWRGGTTVLPDIVIERELGWGGMGVVYLATQRITGRPLALKRLAAADASAGAEAARRRLIRELTAWLNLPPHPNIVPCLFFRTLENGELVIFSPYIDGGTVKQWIEDGRARQRVVAMDIGIQIADGLAAIHSQDVLHQDVKPANVMMSREGAASITDFGLARTFEDQPGQRGYTVAYASPEQIGRKQLTAVTDVFGWGATMAHLLLGQLEWSTGPELSRAWRSLATAAHVDDDVAALVGTCLDVEPSRRPSIGSVATTLRALAQRAFADARPAPVSSREASGAEVSKVHLFQLESVTAFGWMMLGPIYWHLKASVLGIEAGPFDDPALKTTRAQLAQDVAELARLTPLFAAAARERPEVVPWCIRLLIECSLTQSEVGDFNGAVKSAREAVARCAEVPDLSAEERAAAHHAAARALRGAGLREDALRELELLPTLLSGRPAAIGILITIANLQADLCHLGPAIATYERTRSLLGEREPSLMRDFDLSRIDGELAQLHRRTHHLDAALRSIEDAIAGYERIRVGLETVALQSGFSFYVKGTILTDWSRHDEAIVAYDKAIELMSAAPPGVVVAMQIDAARMSRALSLAGGGRLDEAIREMERVIERRKQWVQGQGLTSHAPELARAYMNKASLLGQKGDFQRQCEAKFEAYKLLSKLNNEFQRQDIRPELYVVAGSLGEDLMRMGDWESARKLIGAATATLELVCQDAAANAPALVPKYEVQLVSKYYQLSFLCTDEQEELGEAHEKLLDLCLGLGMRLMARGGDAGTDDEVIERVVAALTDKAVLSLKREEREIAEPLLQEAVEIWLALIREGRDWLQHTHGGLRAAGVWASLIMEEKPREAVEIFSVALGAVEQHGPAELPPEVADRLALAWIGKARAQRGLGNVDDVVQSYSRGAEIWEAAIRRKFFRATQSYSQFACDHANWLIERGRLEPARQALTSMIDTFDRLARETDSPEARSAVAHYRKAYRSVLA